MLSKLIRRVLLGSQYVEGVATRQELDNLTAAVLQLNDDRTAMAKQLDRIERKVYRDLAKDNGDDEEARKVATPQRVFLPGEQLGDLDFNIGG